MAIAFKFKDFLVTADPEDVPSIKELASDSSNKLRGFTSWISNQGPLIIHNTHMKTLAAVIFPHKKNEIVRPINGDWLDIRKENLKAFKP